MYSRRQPPKKKTESKNFRTNLELPALKSMVSDFHVFDFLFKKNLRRGLRWNIRKKSWNNSTRISLCLSFCNFHVIICFNFFCQKNNPKTFNLSFQVPLWAFILIGRFPTSLEKHLPQHHQISRASWSFQAHQNDQSNVHRRSSTTLPSLSTIYPWHPNQPCPWQNGRFTVWYIEIPTCMIYGWFFLV